MARRRDGSNLKHWLFEYPSGLGYTPNGDNGRAVSMVDNRPLYGPATPKTPIQALMEADAFEEPRLDEETLERSALKVDEILGKVLTEDERFVVESVVYGGMSLAETGDALARQRGRGTRVAKSTIMTIKNRAMEKLKDYYEKEGSG